MKRFSGIQWHNSEPGERGLNGIIYGICEWMNDTVRVLETVS